MLQPVITLYISLPTTDHMACLHGLQAYLDRQQLTWPVTYMSVADGQPDADHWVVVLRRQDATDFPHPVPAERLLSILHHSDDQVSGACRIDRACIGTLAATYLADQGFRHAAIIDTAHSTKPTQREAFLQTCARRRVHTTTYLLRDQAHEPDLIDWLRDAPKPMAIHCYSDGQGHWLRNLAHNAGLRIPSDIAILGTNNQLSKCLKHKPHLSSIALPWQLIGEATGAQLHHRILGQHVPPPTALKTFRIIDRDSCRPPAPHDPLVTRATTWLGRHLACRRPLAEAAAAVGCAQPTLTQHFRRSANRTVKQTLDRLRLEQAQRLLLETTLPIAEVGKRSGYASPAAFGIAFKRLTGISPRAWRASHGNSGH